MNSAAKLPVFMAGVPGIEPILNSELCKNLLNTISYMNLEKAGKFPGSVIVPMSKANINLLAEEEYVVSIKLDGTRYLMLIINDNVFFINRNAEAFRANSTTISSQLHFVYPEVNDETKPELKSANQGLSLLDGEMILEAPNKTPVFIVFDVMCMNGLIMTGWNFEKRLTFINILAYEPQYPFAIRPNGFYPLSETGNLLKKEVRFHTDGLVFTAMKRAYNCWPTVPGVKDHDMKWKPGHLNTVDFRLKLDTQENKSTGILYVWNNNKTGEDEFAKIDVTPELEKLEGKIIECTKQGDKWAFYRERLDKDMPNTIATTEATVKSIDDAISEVELVEFIRTSGLHSTYKDDVTAFYELLENQKIMQKLFR